MWRYLKAFTLVELLIAIVLLGIIVLSISSIEVFSRNQLFSADIRAKIQNEGSFLLEHMTKYIGRTIGNADTNPNKLIYTHDSADTKTKTVAVFIDANGNGKRDSNDHWIAYEFFVDNYTLKFCYDAGNEATVPNCPYTACTGTWEILSTKIRRFDRELRTESKNVLDVSIVGSNAPTEVRNDQKNPDIRMETSIIMSAVSVG